MELKILEETQNPLFNRKEVKALIQSGSSLKKQEAKELLANKFSSMVEAIKIKTILGRFGSSDFIVDANIYKDVEARKAVEPDSKKEAEAAAAAEPKVEEKPVEEVKEEIKEETPEVKTEEAAE